MTEPQLVDSELEDLEPILMRARAGDREAIGQLFVHFHDVTSKMAKGESSVVQMTMFQAWIALEGFRGDTINEVRAWLTSILRNCIFQRYRHDHRAKRMPKAGFSDRDIDTVAGNSLPPDALIEKQEQYELVRRMLDTLNDGQRLVIWLRYYEENSLEEIAAKLNKSIEAVESVIARAKRKLQWEFGDD